jgi:transcriptional regulator with GAF, ATPase, and Fis domain
VDDKQRHRRLRLLIKKLNKDRKKQNQKIDILCNDLIAAQRNFIKRLGIINFAANFYESILGTTDLNKLLFTAVEFIKAENEDANVIFFLRQEENFELHMFESGRPLAVEKQYIENCFTQELMDSISKSNKVCSVDDMFAMGLHGNLNELNKISAVTIPLGLLGSSLGFILLYRSSENKLTADEISRISAVISGLSQAITSCQTLSSTAD